ncbi:MAG: hypothetical protein EOP60_01375 [Sphingomonadales bacterium]|nr:MAG: hypothetical protein EOP60_01375 [Sphingomonadales bacterium]
MIENCAGGKISVGCGSGFLNGAKSGGGTGPASEAGEILHCKDQADGRDRSSLHPLQSAAKFEESVMRHWTLSAAIVAAIPIASPSAASPAQGVASGGYVLDRERSDDAFQAIESAIAGLSNAKRPLARMRLRKSIATDRIRISSSGDRVSIAYDAKTPIVVWIGGEPIRWKLVEELVFDVSAKADGEAISLTFRGDDSERTTVYRSVGQQLVEETTIISPLLSAPINYRLVYSRGN